MITVGRIAAAIAAIVLLIVFISVAATNIRLTKVNAEYERTNNSLDEVKKKLYAQQASIDELLRRATIEKAPIQPESDNFYQPAEPLQSNPPCCGCK